MLCPSDYYVALDPLITIQSAVSATDGSAIGQVTISEIYYEGVRQNEADIRFLLNSNARNMTDEGDRMTCTVACGFAGEEGRWEFMLSAPGFADKRIGLDAFYAGSERIDECSLKPTDGPILDVSLEPEE